MCAGTIPFAAAPKKPFSPFPSRTHWSLALKSSLTAQPAFDGAAGYFPIEGDRVAAYDLEKGSLRWVAMTASRSTPAVGGDYLFVDAEKTLKAIRTSDGSAVWEVPLADPPTQPLVFASSSLIAVTQQAVAAYRAHDGSLVWRRELGGVRTAPAAANDHLYLSLDDGRVLALRAADGESAWERKIGGMPNEILALETQLFVGSTDNYLYCLKAMDGDSSWRKRTGADVVSRPWADNDNVYFISLDNVLRALNRGHGVQQWMRSLPFRSTWPPIAALDALVVAGPTVPPRGYFLKDGKPADVLNTETTGDIIAPLYTFASPIGFGPIIVLVTRSISGEATVLATSRAVEPPLATTLGPLPNVTPVAVPKP